MSKYIIFNIHNKIIIHIYLNIYNILLSNFDKSIILRIKIVSVLYLNNMKINFIKY